MEVISRANRRREKVTFYIKYEIYMRGLRLGEARGESHSQEIYLIFLLFGRRMSFFFLTDSKLIST